MLRIQRAANREVIFSLTGRIEADDMDELQRLVNLEERGRDIVFDLQEITRVDRDGVEFLGRCEAEQRIKLENCPPYVREWIDIERRGSNTHKS
jgi:anti-anti-sigma regulatory factor